MAEIPISYFQTPEPSTSGRTSPAQRSGAAEGIIRAGEIQVETAERQFGRARRTTREAEALQEKALKEFEIRELSQAGDIAMNAVLSADVALQKLEQGVPAEEIVQRGRDAFDKIETDAIKRATMVSPAAGELVRNKLAQAKLSRIPELARRADKMLTDRETARLEDRVEFQTREILRQTDPSLQATMAAELLGEITAIGRTLLGEEKTAQLRRDVSKRVRKEIVTGAILHDPVAGMELAQKADFLPSERQQFMVLAEGRLNHLDALQRRQEREQEKAEKAQLDAIQTEAIIQVVSGKDIQTFLIQHGRQLGPQRLQSLLALNKAYRDDRNKPPGAVRTEPVGYLRMQNEISKASAPINTDQLVTFLAGQMKASALTGDDASALLRQADTKNKQLAGEAKTARTEDVKRGETYIKNALKTKGMLDFDATSQFATEEALRDFYDAVQDPTVDPGVTAGQIAQKYRRTIRDRISVDNPEEFKRIFGFKTKKEVVDALDRGDITRPQANRAIERLELFETNEAVEPPTSAPESARPKRTTKGVIR